MSEQLSMTWGCCDLNSDETDFMTCSKCNKCFHLACLPGCSKADHTQVLQGWTCPTCMKPKIAGYNNDNTPLRSGSDNTSTRVVKRMALQSPEQEIANVFSREDLQDIVQDIFAKQMEAFFDRLDVQIKSTVTTALAPVTKDIQELKQTLHHVYVQYEDIANKQTVMSNTVKELQDENLMLRSNNLNLATRLNNLEQYMPGMQTSKYNVCRKIKMRTLLK